MKESDFYVLYSHNIPVRGKEISAIYNVHKGKIIFLPNSMVDIIEELRSNSIADLRLKITEKADKKIFDEYLLFLEKHRLGMYVDNPEQFPPMQKLWRNPYDIMTAVIEFDCFHQNYDLLDVLKQLDSFSCNFLELRCYKTDLSFITKVLNTIYFSGFRSINLVLEYMPGIESEIEKIYQKHTKLECILIFDSPLKISNPENDAVKFTTMGIDDNNLHISGGELIINTKYFMEAQFYHPYFNRKVVIDRFGNLKNDLSFQKIFGNVNGREIASVLENTDFKDLWNACPDKVIEYQNDPLRYCRIYTDNLKKINGVYTVVN